MTVQVDALPQSAVVEERSPTFHDTNTYPAFGVSLRVTGGGAYAASVTVAGRKRPLDPAGGEGGAGIVGKEMVEGVTGGGGGDVVGTGGTVIGGDVGGTVGAVVFVGGLVGGVVGLEWLGCVVVVVVVVVFVGGGGACAGVEVLDAAVPNPQVQVPVQGGGPPEMS